MKGVQYVASQYIRLDAFTSCLYENVIPYYTSRGLKKNKKQQIEFYENEKKALNPLFKKFRVQSDRISCLPLTKNGKIL